MGPRVDRSFFRFLEFAKLLTRVPDVQKANSKQVDIFHDDITPPTVRMMVL